MDKIYPHDQKIVVLGGGTGQFNLLRGLVELNTPEFITAVPGTWDNGGSTGRLRTELGILPPGDARRCLIALMEDDTQREIAIQLFEDRMEGFGETLQGQAVGNLIIAWLERANGGQDYGLSAACKLFGIKSTIARISLNKLTLMTKTLSGHELRGEELLDNRGKADGFDPNDRISSIYFESPAKPNLAVLEKITQADKIVFSMGSLYGSILPHLIVPQVRETIISSKGKIYLVSNIMTETGQTDSLETASAHLKEFIRYLGSPERLNVLIINDKQLPSDILEVYKQEGQTPIKADKDLCLQLCPNLTILEGDLLEYFPNEHLIRHDPQKLAELILVS